MSRNIIDSEIMNNNLVAFTIDDLQHEVEFILTDDEHEIFNIHSCKGELSVFKGLNLIARIDRITKNGFHWGKWYFGKRVVGFYTWKDLRKIGTKQVLAEPIESSQNLELTTGKEVSNG